MIKPSFTEKDEQISDVLCLIYTNICGSMSTSAKGGHQYFIIFTDDLLRYKNIYLMKNKLESFEIFK